MAVASLQFKLGERAVSIALLRFLLLCSVVRGTFSRSSDPPTASASKLRQVLRHPELQKVLLQVDDDDQTRRLSSGTFGKDSSGRKPQSLELRYGIFRGKSSLRDLPLKQSALSFFDEDDNNDEDDISSSRKALFSLVLILMERLDEAHEVVLGVRPSNMIEAEYAATHPGETDWTSKHRLSEVDDMIHSLIHRLEGSRVGEGNHTGYENAKYWAAGGPKRHEMIPIATSGGGDSSGRRSGANHQIIPSHHPHLVPWQLARIALKRAPRAVASGVVVDTSVDSDEAAASAVATKTSFASEEEELLECGRQHNILADGGLRRTVLVRPGCWDPIRFIDLLSRPEREDGDDDERLLRQELHGLQEEEISLLLQYELLRFQGLSNDQIRAQFVKGDD